MTRSHISTRERTALFLAAGGCCAHCSVKIQPGQGWDLDHVRPLELLGTDEPTNWQVLCKPCHRAKTSNDVSRIAKAKRQQAKHIGSKKTRNEMLFSRKSPWKKKVNGEIVRRNEYD